MLIDVCRNFGRKYKLCLRKIWSPTLREEHKLRVFENRVVRRIFGPKRDGVIGGWRNLHNVELRNMYSSPNIIRMMKSRKMRLVGYEEI
jgi:hypothetical protein